ncbi:MAG: O-methyltransferase [Methyloceanibacter sp.]|uniref:O-methyltransferase n=1 Tax=Methyloceanibacter sp. TaxID=1965321 RepID=UPI003D9B976B
MKPLEQDDNWIAVDEYLTDRLVEDDPALAASLKDSAKAGLPPINVSPNQGKFLMLLAQAIGARRILEIGTLGGYSAIWLARALPADGRLLSLEADPAYAELARANLARAGLAEKVEVRVGRAQDTLPELIAEGAAPFDLIFIDADKPSTPDYYQWSVELARRGSLIVVDNVVREGRVIDAKSDSPHIQGLRRFFDLAAADSRVSGTAIQTVGAKGHDGLAILRVTAD